MCYLPLCRYGSPHRRCAPPPHKWGGSLSRSRAIEFAQVGQSLGDLAGERHRLPTADVDDLLGDPHLEEAPAQREQLAAVGAIPAELDRMPDLRRIPAHRTAGLLEHRSELVDFVELSAGDVPDVGVAGDQ